MVMDRAELQDEFIEVIHRFMKTNMNELFVDISKEEFFMLEMIGRHADEEKRYKGINVSELAKQLGVSSPAVSRMLKFMETKKLIYRVADEEDRRNTCVFLTAEGRNLRDTTMKVLGRFLDRIIAHMGIEEIRILLTSWHKLADVLEIELKKL